MVLPTLPQQETILSSYRLTNLMIGLPIVLAPNRAKEIVPCMCEHERKFSLRNDLQTKPHLQQINCTITSAKFGLLTWGTLS